MLNGQVKYGKRAEDVYGCVRGKVVHHVLTVLDKSKQECGSLTNYITLAAD